MTSSQQVSAGNGHQKPALVVAEVEVAHVVLASLPIFGLVVESQRRLFAGPIDVRRHVGEDWLPCPDLFFQDVDVGIGVLEVAPKLQHILKIKRVVGRVIGGLAVEPDARVSPGSPLLLLLVVSLGRLLCLILGSLGSTPSGLRRRILVTLRWLRGGRLGWRGFGFGCGFALRRGFGFGCGFAFRRGFGLGRGFAFRRGFGLRLAMGLWLRGLLVPLVPIVLALVLGFVLGLLVVRLLAGFVAFQ